MFTSVKDTYLVCSTLKYPFNSIDMTPASKSLGELVSGLSQSAPQSVSIKGVTCNSRSVKRGYLFVAVSGNKIDGHSFIEDAVNRGCAAVIVEREMPMSKPIPQIKVSNSRKALAEISTKFYDNPSQRLKVIGITGTNGKTTTSFIVKSILEAAGEKVGLIGTIEYIIGDRVISANNTTPGADDIQRYLWEMEQAGCKSAVMEVSSHSLSQDRVSCVSFSAGIFTNITRDHFDYHKTFENYRDAKGVLFKMLSTKAIAVLNADDKSSSIFSSDTKGKVVRYGLDGAYDVIASIEKMDLGGTSLILLFGGDGVKVESKLIIGRHNVYNILAAAATCWKMGYDLEHIARGIENVKCVPGRMEIVNCGQDFTVLVDYAHTDDALKNVITCLKPLQKGKLIVVFGCGGDRDKGKRPKMGRVAEELADYVLLTSDNPRSEEPMSIIKDIENGISDKSKYVVEVDRGDAIRRALSMVDKGDIVLIAGKGHETYQIFRDKTINFDDRIVAKQTLTAMIKSAK